MTTLSALPSEFGTTRENLKRVAVHIVARARQQSTGRFGLRVTPNGFGTPEFGPDLKRVRVAGGGLVVESGAADNANAQAGAIDGSTLTELAELAGVDLTTSLDVGRDTPDLGDIEQPLVVDESSAVVLAAWFGVVNAGLDRVVAGASTTATPSLVQLWPEHFDAALDLSVTDDRRVNLGGSPGDGFSSEPYLYVGPWTEDRPGDPQFWNAPFGATLGYDELRSSDDPVAAATDFYQTGIRQLSA